jgi:hypothetical protein
MTCTARYCRSFFYVTTVYTRHVWMLFAECPGLHGYLKIHLFENSLSERWWTFPSNRLVPFTAFIVLTFVYSSDGGWLVRSCHQLLYICYHVVYMGRLDSEDGGIRLPRNLDNYLPISTANSYPRGLVSSSPPLWDHQIHHPACGIVLPRSVFLNVCETAAR